MCTVHYSSFLVGLFKVMIRITGTRVMQSACRCRQWCSISSTPGQVNLLIGGQCAFRESLRCLWTLPKYSAQSEIVTDAPNSRTEREMYRVRPKTNKQRRLMAWNLQGKNNHYESSAKQRFFFKKLFRGFLRYTFYVTVPHRAQRQYWAGRTLPPNNLPPNMAANDFLQWNATLLSCSNSRVK